MSGASVITPNTDRAAKASDFVLGFLTLRNRTEVKLLVEWWGNLMAPNCCTKPPILQLSTCKSKS